MHSFIKVTFATEMDRWYTGMHPRNFDNLREPSGRLRVRERGEGVARSLALATPPRSGSAKMVPLGCLILA